MPPKESDSSTSSLPAKHSGARKTEKAGPDRFNFRPQRCQKRVGSQRRVRHSFAPDFMEMKPIKSWLIIVLTAGLATAASASEADIVIPPLDAVKFAGLGGVTRATLMYLGILICGIGAIFS